MIDPRLLLDQPQLIRDNLARRQQKFDLQPLINEVERRKQAQQKLEELRHQNKLASEKVGTLMRQKNKEEADVTRLKEESSHFKTQIHQTEELLQALEGAINEQILRLPNILDESVPTGNGADDNQEIRRWGNTKTKQKKPLEHDEIGKRLGIIDFERGSKIAGARFAVLMGWGARLELALIQFMIDNHCSVGGYIPVLTPYLVNEKAITGTGQLPKFREEVFALEKDPYFLIPTAEVPVTNLHAGEILNEADLPLRYVSFSPCFRREAGSYGKDTRGLIRQHQFHKVEMVKFATPTSSNQELESMVADAERILQKLGLPYRVVALCTADIGFAAAKCYDLEVWLAGSQTYREISSCSNCTDFQARRIEARYKPQAGGKTSLVHTLNGSGLAVGRTLIALLEYYYNDDGSVTIPEILRPYLAGIEKITAA